MKTASGLVRHILPVMMMWLAAGSSLFAQSTNFQFTPLQRLVNRENVVTLTTPTNGAYDLLVSTNLVQWSALVTALCTNGSLQHTDSAAPSLEWRFYKGEQLTNSKAITGDHIPTDTGDLVIHRGYHASFAMSWNNLMIYVDPTNSFPELPRADLILLTHNHADHFNTNYIYKVKGPNAILVVPHIIYTSSQFRGLTNNSIVLSNGFSTNLLGINIEAVPMYNTTGSINHVKGVGNGYVLTIGGKRIYISGDSDDTPEMCALQNIDVAFLAMNTYTLDLGQALHAVRSFLPKIVYIEHYSGTQPADLSSFKTQIMADPGTVEVRLRNWY
jgi:L-ascorbate metabolism protein UlaG (beta-lactamase superfamily)